ncbi:hypothetical protein ACROYT_G032341 [Oculina patagonica]
MFILTEEFKPVLAKGGGRLKPKVKLLEKSIAELKAKMVEQGGEARATEQEAKIKALEDCDACSKIKDLNDTINNLPGKGNSKTTSAAAGLEDSEILKANASYLKNLGDCHYHYDSSAFLFSLVNKPGLQPLKLNQNGEGDNRETSIYSCSYYLPVFGAGNDFTLGNTGPGQSNLGYTYGPPTGYSFGSSEARSFLAGSYNFKPDEAEVFYETS